MPSNNRCSNKYIGWSEFLRLRCERTVRHHLAVSLSVTILRSVLMAPITDFGELTLCMLCSALLFAEEIRLIFLGLFLASSALPVELTP
jgi:hypothetical protein